ncbi:MAG TPA: tripartite tricarboxylate transporter substrate binding protein [Burkholderiales bacterium]|nr:tripartite tricarboxylate transporter substrate binding protein [Burkholderiales bacterium]
MSGKLLEGLRWMLLLALAASAGPAAAQKYPVRPLRLLVPFGPGGVGDLTARAVAQKMSENMGQQVIIDNRPSAGGIVATEMVAKAEPDGYTLLLLNNTNTVSAALFRKLPYDTVKDFAMVSTLGGFSIAVVVSPDSQLKSVKDVIAQARANPNKLNIGTINIGSTQNLAAELFKSMAGIDVVTVPFNSTGAVITALRGNNVQVAFDFLPALLGQIKAGGLRALAVTPPKRYSVLPEVPTVAESGVPGYEVTGWNGIAVPAKTPKALIERLNKEVHAAVNAPDVAKRLQEVGVEQRLSTPEGMREFVIADIAKWNGVIDKAKIQRQ